MKPFKNRQNSEFYKNKIQCFKNKSKTTRFDLAACKCDTLINCLCSKSQKVPLDEREFLLNQRGPRKMVISSIDRENKNKYNQREQR